MQNGTEPKKHTFAVLVENKFGVLSRVAGLFSARGYNIESLSVGETLDPTVSRMTLVVRGDEFVIEQVELLRPFGIQERVRTGKVAIARRPKGRARRAEEKLGKAQEAARAVSQALRGAPNEAASA